MHGLKSKESRYARFSTQKRNPPLSKSLPVCKCNTGFIQPLIFVYGLLSPVNCLLTWVRKTCMHTNFGNNYKKPGVPTAGLAALPRLSNHQCIMQHRLFINNLLCLVIVLNDYFIKLIMYFIIQELLGIPEIRSYVLLKMLTCTTA